MTGSTLPERIWTSLMMPSGADSPPSPRCLFCFGLGYSAEVLGRQLLGEGFTCVGTTRDPARAEALRRAGFEILPFDGTAPLDRTAFEGITHLLISIPPGPGGDPVLRLHAADLAARMQASPSLAWVGYLSTTGVYGNRDGGWVDEGSPLRPGSDRARRRVEAERAWLLLGESSGLPVHIFRLAGIYGPGRSILDSLRSGTARRILRPGHRFSRIHVEDIARVLRASMARPRPGAIYNLCDDTPAEPAEVVTYAAGLLGLDPPPPTTLEEADLSPMARSFWADNKQVRNQRIKTELGVRLVYPDFRSGLRAVLDAESVSPKG